MPYVKLVGHGRSGPVDVTAEFARIPHVGEQVVHGDVVYEVIAIEWTTERRSHRSVAIPTAQLKYVRGHSG
jgi:hypothetical protein